MSRTVTGAKMRAARDRGMRANEEIGQELVLAIFGSPVA
jgi:hypothetical protein